MVPPRIAIFRWNAEFRETDRVGSDSLEPELECIPVSEDVIDRLSHHLLGPVADIERGGKRASRVVGRIQKIVGKPLGIEWHNIHAN